MVSEEKPIVKYTLNSAEYDLAVKDALKEIRSLKPVFKGIVKEFYKSNKAIFALKSAGQYEDFKGKTDEYGLTKYQKFKISKIGKSGFNVGTDGYPLLKLTGRLEESITVRGSADAIEEITNASLVVGTKVSYGIYHQSEEPRKKIPYRPFLFLDPSTSRYAQNPEISRRSVAWATMIQNYVKRKLASLGKIDGGQNES